jgi:adenosylcobinamide kinase/adenosylcobinamide-phosphate guanylyltransferase
MGKIILVTGGARSGKSTFAEAQVKEKGKKPGYIATGIAFDEGMKHRIQMHINQRPASWKTYEKPTKLHEIMKEVLENHDVVLVDCITVLLSNYLLEAYDELSKQGYEALSDFESYISKELDLFMDLIESSSTTCYLVTNEVGAGIVPENKMARVFRDLAGRSNQQIAKRANEVYYVVSGIAQRIKG